MNILATSPGRTKLRARLCPRLSLPSSLGHSRLWPCEGANQQRLVLGWSMSLFALVTRPMRVPPSANSFISLDTHLLPSQKSPPQKKKCLNSRFRSLH